MIDKNIFITELRKDNNIKEVRSFVLRNKSLNKTQIQILEQYYNNYGLVFKDELLDHNKVFNNDNDVIIEIGFGNGQATYQIAKDYKNKNFIGIEVYLQGYLQLLNKIGCDKLSNIKLIRFDAVAVLDHMIENNSISGFHIFFPDPWQKKKHHKRRLIQKDFVSKLISKLKEGGYIYIATDWQDYSDQINDVLSSFDNLELTSKPKTMNRGQTCFEKKGLDKNHKITEFWVIKKIGH